MEISKIHILKFDQKFIFIRIEIPLRGVDIQVISQQRRLLFIFHFSKLILLL